MTEHTCAGTRSMVGTWLEAHSHWSKLRDLGQSNLVRASVLMPVLRNKRSPGLFHPSASGLRVAAPVEPNATGSRLEPLPLYRHSGICLKNSRNIPASVSDKS